MTCLDCNGPVSTQSKTGRCRKCAFAHTKANPAIEAKRLSALDSIWHGAEHRQWRQDNARKAAATRMVDPVYVATITERMRRVQPLSLTPEALAKRNQREVQARRHREKITWCPDHKLDAFRLLRRKKFTVAEAKALILAEIEREEARLSPFERQERALQRGAKLVANDLLPWGRCA